MSKLTIRLNISGDVTNTIKFVPAMVDVHNRKTDIFFPPTFKLSETLIRNAVPEAISVPEVLTTPHMFIALVKFATDRSKGYKRLSMSDPKTMAIVHYNMEYIKSLWLKNNTKILIADRAYTIVKSKIIKKTDHINNAPELKFDMTVSLKIIRKDRDTLVNRQKMSCDDQRNTINELYEELFGQPFFGYRAPSTTHSLAPVMYTNNTGYATGKSPTKTAQPINPYAPFMPNSRGLAPYGMMPAMIPMQYADPKHRPSDYPGKTHASTH